MSDFETAWTKYIDQLRKLDADPFNWGQRRARDRALNRLRAIDPDFVERILRH